MTQPIYTQNVVVWYKRDRNYSESISYKLQPVGHPPPPTLRRSANWNTVTAVIRSLQTEVHDLLGRAVYRGDREGHGVERAARALATEVLPPQGFIGLLHPGVHPCLDVDGDDMAEIPWEALEESYYVCPTGMCHTDPLDPRPSASTYCPTHGCKMVPAGGKLALSYHLTYLVRGEGRPIGRGRRFLVIEDPTGDLCGSQEVAAHVDRVCDLLEQPQQGCKVVRRAQAHATRERILRDIADPTLMGIYYFGHGRLPQGRPWGCLVLADGELSAVEIDKHAPTAPFVFLNACEAGAVPAPSTTGTGMDEPVSVASAFARGGAGRVVIAPLWPIVSNLAAQSALTFFESACGTSAPLAECLRLVREKSLQRYSEGKPDACWLSYRYFGDPNRTLALQDQRPIEMPGAVSQELVADRVFRDRQRLSTDVFGFGIDDVLFRAAKRRNTQQRKHVTNGDLIAGLVRKGELTRYAIQDAGADPDAIYRPILDHKDEGRELSDEKWDQEDSASSGDGDKKDKARDALRRFIARFVVRDKKEFAPEVVEILSRADRDSLTRHGGAMSPPIPEEDILVNLIATPHWHELESLGLPPPAAVQRAVKKRSEDGLDANGFVSLERLDANAKRVIQDAHTLAQQRGEFPISHRAVFAAFLADKEGFAARACRAASVPTEPEVLCRVMRAAVKETESPKSFGLSLPACRRVIIPLLRRAIQLAEASNSVTERDLFMAFCETAGAHFKKWVKTPPYPVNLDVLKTVTLSEQDGQPASDGLSEHTPSATPADKKGTPDASTTGGNAHEEDGAVPLQFPPGPGLSASDFEPAAWRVVGRAEEIARGANRPMVNSPHLFAAMLDAADGHLVAMMSQRTMDRENLKRVALSLLAPGERPLPESQALLWSPNSSSILARARIVARSSGRTRVSNDDLLAAFFADGGGVVGQVLMAAGLEALTSSITMPATLGREPKQRNLHVLDQFGVDLTEMARNGRLPEVVGRDREIETTMQTLMLSESANPLLVGEAGVGKTAIVGGIAQRIVSEHCPQKLRTAKIIELSAGSLVADTPLRGEFEKRLQQLLTEIKGKNIILFIDEIHAIVGAGSGGMGHLDAGNMLKASLARGEVRIIGATTPPEYRQTIERDKALARRFQKVLIRPPSREATIQMLSSTRKRLEGHHAVHVSDPAIAAAVDLSGRYMHDKQWPAKARDVLDRACVVSVEEGSSQQPAQVTVSPEHVARVVATMTGLPLDQVSTSDLATLATLEDRVRKRIVGQDEAIHAVAEAIRRGRQGLATGDRPWGVFLFVGPPGVGKTELAKVLADEVFGSPDGMIRFDMGDFTEPHSTARLVGSPPGYVGYDRGAPLVEKLRANPYSLLLFDEIEQAHENVLATLLRLLSEGTITDSDGMTADARNSIVIMTSNILDGGHVSTGIGFAPQGNSVFPAEADQRKLKASLSPKLPSRLLDRVDTVVLFRALGVSDLAAIAERSIRDVVAKIGSAHGLTLEVSPRVAPWLAEKISAAGSGARDIQRAIDRYVGEALAEFAGSHANASGSFEIAPEGDAITVVPSQ